MALSEFYESTIVHVSATFGFSGFECSPSEITDHLQVEPVETMVKGDPRQIREGKTIKNFASSWYIASDCDSKDVNIHLRQLLERIPVAAFPSPERFGSPSFSVVWKSNYLYAGSGPFYESDVLAGIARLGAMLWHDIYQVDSGTDFTRC